MDDSTKSHTPGVIVAMRRLTLASAALIVVAAPLAFHPAVERGFVLPKLLALQTFTTMGLAAALAAWLATGAPLPGVRLPRGLAVLLLGWLLWTGSAYLTAFDRARSWTGSTEWVNGLQTRLFLFGMAWLVFSATLHSGAPARLQRALVWTSIPVVAYGLAQAAGYDPIDWFHTTFVFSTLGNANRLAGYLVMAAPFTIALIAGTSGRIARLAGVGLLSAQILTLAATRSRAGLAALAVTLIVLAVFRRARQPRRPLRWVVAGAITTLLVTFAVGSSGDSIFALAGGAEPRPAVWLSALNAILARPITGWGPGSFDLTLGAHASAVFREYLASTGSLWDRTHNIWLEWAVETGLPGLALSALLLWSVVRTAVAALENAPGQRRWLPAAGAAALVGYFMQQLLNTSSIGLTVLAWWIAAFTVGISAADSREPWPHLARLSARQRVVAGVLALSLVGATGVPAIIDTLRQL